MALRRDPGSEGSRTSIEHGRSGVTVWSETSNIRATALRFARQDELEAEVFHFSGQDWKRNFRRFVQALDDRQVTRCLATSRCERGTFQPWQAVALSTMADRLESEWFPAVLTEKALVSVLQPIWSLRDSKVLGFEALSRAKKGSELINGGVLFDAARVHGLLSSFDAAARRAAILQGVSHLESEERLFINILPGLIESPESDFAETWAAMKACDIAPERLVFEFVESESLPPLPKLAKIVGHIRSKGAMVALDDFGAGHSSLTTLDELRPDIVKFDRSLLPQQTSVAKEALLRGLVDYAQALDIRTVAEGIETMTQLAIAEACGFDYVQGWLIGKPSEVPERPQAISFG